MPCSSRHWWTCSCIYVFCIKYTVNSVASLYRGASGMWWWQSCLISFLSFSLWFFSFFLFVFSLVLQNRHNSNKWIFFFFYTVPLSVRFHVCSWGSLERLKNGVILKPTCLSQMSGWDAIYSMFKWLKQCTLLREAFIGCVSILIHSMPNAVFQKYQDVLLHLVPLCSMHAFLAILNHNSMLFETPTLSPRWTTGQWLK